MRRHKLALTVCLTVLAVAGLPVLSSCGGGGGGAPSRPGSQVTITPPGSGPAFDNSSLPADHSDEPNTPAGASTITAGQTVTGYIDSPGDLDYFRFSVSQTSVVDFNFDGPPGTKFTVQTEDGRIVATRVIGSTTSSYPSLAPQTLSIGIRPQVAIAVPVLLHAGRYVVQVAAGAAARRAVPYAIGFVASALGAAKALDLVIRTVDLDVEADLRTEFDLEQYVDCIFENKDDRGMRAGIQGNRLGNGRCNGWRLCACGSRDKGQIPSRLREAVRRQARKVRSASE